MRSFRTAILGLALAAIAVAGSSTAALAGTEKSGTTDTWTFVEGTTRYENVLTIDAKVQQKSDGSLFVTLVASSHIDIYENGVHVAVIDRVEQSKSAYVDGGRVALAVKVKQTASEAGVTCTYRTFLRIVDLEVVKDQQPELACH